MRRTTSNVSRVQPKPSTSYDQPLPLLPNHRIQVPSINFAVASPGSGKSHYIKSEIYALTRSGVFGYGICICPTARNTGDYNFMPQDHVYTRYDDSIIDHLMKTQSENIRRGKNIQAFLILDDCLGTVKWNDSIMSELITTYRHYGITVFIATQYVMAIPPIIRECATNVLVFHLFSEKSITSIKDAFIYNIDKKSDVKKFIEANTRDYHILLVRCQGALATRYSRIKAIPRIPQFKLTFKR